MPPPQTDLVIVGAQRGRRYSVTIYGKPVWLSGGPFEALLVLAAGRLSPGAAGVRLSAVVVCRLRQQLARGIGAASAARLIVACGTEEYVLKVAASQIAVAPGFRTCALRAPKVNRRRAALLQRLQRVATHQHE